MTARTVLSAAMSEAELQTNILDLCRVLGLLAYHTHDARRSQPGFPDLVIVGPGGVLFRELKAAKGRCTPVQLVWLDALDAAGADASVWFPGDWPDQIRHELAAIRKAGA